MHTGTIRVFTFKDRRKLLSTVAHDLQLTLERFEVVQDGDHWTVRCFLDSLVVDGAATDGGVGPMRDKDRRDILENLRKKVLHTRRHPEARFEGVFASGRISGRLTLVGRDAEIDFAATEADGRLRGRVELRPTRWGIKPFKALMGAIALEDRVIIEIDVPT